MSSDIKEISGLAAPLVRPNIDTDTIAPAFRPAQATRGDLDIGKASDSLARAMFNNWMQSARQGSNTDEGHGSNTDASKNLFAAWRYDDNDDERRDFVLNREPFRRASILLTGANFGCGSSREFAVDWLRDFGFRCVIAPSFADIFSDNCYRRGLLPVTVGEQTVKRWAKLAEGGDPKARFIVSLDRCSVRAPDGSVEAFTIPEFRRRSFMQRKDEVDLCVSYSDRIDEYQGEFFEAHPWVVPRDRLKTGTPPKRD